MNIKYCNFIYDDRLSYVFLVYIFSKLKFDVTIRFLDKQNLIIYPH